VHNPAEVQLVVCFREKKRLFQNKTITLARAKNRAFPSYVAGLALCGRLVFGRNFIRGLHHFIQNFLELGEAGRGDDDGVAPTADILRDAEEASTRIFLEREYKSLPLNLDFAAF
jgi:hypothetical protein